VAKKDDLRPNGYPRRNRGNLRPIGTDGKVAFQFRTSVPGAIGSRNTGGRGQNTLEREKKQVHTRIPSRDASPARVDGTNR